MPSSKDLYQDALDAVARWGMDIDLPAAAAVIRKEKEGKKTTSETEAPPAVLPPEPLN